MFCKYVSESFVSVIRHLHNLCTPLLSFWTIVAEFCHVFLCLEHCLGSRWWSQGTAAPFSGYRVMQAQLESRGMLVPTSCHLISAISSLTWNAGRQRPAAGARCSSGFNGNGGNLWFLCILSWWLEICGPITETSGKGDKSKIRTCPKFNDKQ